jgi:hypothetical protein
MADIAKAVKMTLSYISERGEDMEQREWDAYLEELQDSINDLKELRESLSDWTSAEE